MGWRSSGGLRGGLLFGARKVCIISGHQFGMAEAKEASTPFEPRSTFGMMEAQEMDLGMADALQELGR